MTTNTITNMETLSSSSKQNNNNSNNNSISKSNNNNNSGTNTTSLKFSKSISQETKKDLKRKAAIQATADWNSLLIWARKQRGPYYDPSTRMYHVSYNTKKYFAGYTQQDAEAEDAAFAPTSQTTGQQKMNTSNQNNQFKPIASIHNSEILTKEIMQNGSHISSTTRISHSGSSNNGGRRPGRPRKTDHF